jgi:PTH1 family peptidyl-tRNA hydrolase
VRVVFGIGNPGAEYRGTRHNLGFRVVEALSGAPLRLDPRLRAEGAAVRMEGQQVLLVRPLTYVNRCGSVLASLRREHSLDIHEEVLVVVDDFSLPLGRLRLRAQGSDGGHNGLCSLIDHLGSTAFARLRIGIGDPGDRPAEEYVLEPFPESERPVAEEAVERAAHAVRLWVRLGTERAMTEVNRAVLDPGEDRA